MQSPPRAHRCVQNPNQSPKKTLKLSEKFNKFQSAKYTKKVTKTKQTTPLKNQLMVGGSRYFCYWWIRPRLTIESSTGFKSDSFVDEDALTGLLGRLERSKRVRMNLSFLESESFVSLKGKVKEGENEPFFPWKWKFCFLEIESKRGWEWTFLSSKVKVKALLIQRMVQKCHP